MSDTATTTTDLGTFEDEPVLATAVTITKAGDGLSAAMKVTAFPRMRRGEKFKVLLEVEAGKVSHVPAKDGAGWVEVRTLEATGVAFLPAKLEAEVGRVLTETADLIKKAAEEARGVNRLLMGEALAIALDGGDHASGLVPGCPTCQDEADAHAAEADDDFADPAPPPPTSPAVTGDAAVSSLAGRQSRRGKATG